MENFALSMLFLSIVTFLFCCGLRRRPPAVAIPPSPPRRLPIIGHLHLLTDMPHHYFFQLAQKLGPIISLQLGRVPALVISSAQLAELILKTHDQLFPNRPQTFAAQYLSFGGSDVTFAPYGPYWRQARKICLTELLSSKRVSSFKFVRDEEVNRLIQRVSTQSGSQVEISELFFTLANDILCRVAFGKRFIGESGDKKRHDLVTVLNETGALLAGFCIGDFIPEWEWVDSVSGMKRRLARNLEDLRAVCGDIIKEHVKKKQSEADISGKEDFVDVLLRVKQRDDLEIPITDDSLKALVLNMFIAGTDTTSAALEWVMTELARNPRAMKIAQHEVRKIVGKNGEVVEEIHLQHFHYLKCVIKEAMRLHPPVPFLGRHESMEKCTINGYQIPKKTRIFVNAYAIGRDPQSWENPLEYNPDRFKDNDIDFMGRDFKFLPFGGGRRGCPGMLLGLATVEITLARLLYHFDWELPHGIAPNDVDLTETFGLTTKKKTGLVLVPTINKDHGFKGCYFIYEENNSKYSFTS